MASSRSRGGAATLEVVPPFDPPWEGEDVMKADDEMVGATPASTVPEGDSDLKPFDPQVVSMKFEGRKVDSSEVRIAGVTSLESLEDWMLGVDDRVRIVVETRVTSVDHYTNKDGKLVRRHTLKPLRTDVTPWNPSDPTDHGVLRSS